MSINVKTLSLTVLLVGALLPLAFAPFGYYLLAELALMVLLYAISTAAAGRAFWYGWLFGVGFFAFGIYWLYISIHHFGNAPVILALAILGVLIAFLALYPALQSYLLQWLYPQNNWQKLLIAFPALWVIAEWIRGWFLSGFPWLFLGYGHVASALRGWATIFGVYGVSFVIAQTAGAIVCCFYYRNKIKVVAILVLYIVVLWVSGTILARINWNKPIGEPIQVSLIQGNVALQQKWDEKELLPILHSYADLTKQNLASKIIVWPEAAIPIYPENVQLYLQVLSNIAQKHNTTILSGIPFYDRASGKYYNGILAFGKYSGRYYKRYLVPFGEYLPLSFMLGWMHNYLTIPMAEFSRGGKKQPELLVDKTPLAPFICYEIAYANLVLEYIPQAGLLVTVCDDSWFGASIAAAQHLEIARMRSLEVSRYQLLCTNTGITAIIAADGKIIAQAPILNQAVLNGQVQFLSGRTPWCSFGHYILLPLMVLLLWLARAKK